MKHVLAATALVASIGGTAAAQAGGGDLSVSGFNPDNPTAPVQGVDGDGIKVGEGTAIYPVVGLSTGVVSNVFYEAIDPKAAGVLRLITQVGAGSLSAARLTRNNPSAGMESVDAGSFQYRASLNLSYDLLLSGNDSVSSQGGLGIGAALRGIVNPQGTFSFGFDENFTRLVRAANYETDADVNRDINNIGLNLIVHPRGRSIGGYLYYTNTIDIFEEDRLDFADRIQHRFGVHPTWQILPRTSLYSDVSIGVYSGLGSGAAKTDSYPLVAQAGFATLFTPKTSINVRAGYTNGFYSAGPSYSSVTAGVQFGYRYSELGKIGLTYDLIYEDSVNANFYRDHVLRFWVQQKLNPFYLVVQPEVHFRRYEGVNVMGASGTTRDDVIGAVTAGVHYNFRNSLAATLDYSFALVETNFRYMAGPVVDDPSFVRHQLLAGMRWAL